MLQYFIVLLLISASYRSLGVPVNPLANSMTALVNRCENAFLSNQIKSKISYCSKLLPHDDKLLQCIMFYDINTRLCSAVGTSKLALTEDYTAKINEEQNVNSICLAAKDWIFSNVSELPSYKQAVDKIFKLSVTCGKICGVEDFTSDDANFFCKYFKWGTEMLLNHEVSLTSNQENVNDNLSPETSKADKTPVAPTPVEQPQQNSDQQDVQFKTITSNDHKIITPSPVKNEESSKLEINKPETSSLAVNLQNQLDGAVAAPEKPEVAESNVAIEDTGPLPENALSANEHPSKSPDDVVSKGVAGQENAALKPDISGDNQLNPEDSLKTDVDKELQLLNNERKEPVLEGPKVKQPNDLDDYPDSEEGKEGLVPDEDADAMLGAIDMKPEVLKHSKKTETIVSTFSGERDYYGSTAKDVFPDEDHFFPFFLTAVILVVLLYVLYHNKNKVSKVFFGLVLEGRQAGRRRNSRGHAYRRLDTLEQAMSATATAPPTKIIY